MAAVISAILSNGGLSTVKFLKAVLPNISIALSLSLLVLVIVDNRNPMMGFLRSVQAQILIAVAAVIAIATAAVLYAVWRRDGR